MSIILKKGVWGRVEKTHIRNSLFSKSHSIYNAHIHDIEYLHKLFMITEDNNIIKLQGSYTTRETVLMIYLILNFF